MTQKPHYIVRGDLLYLKTEWLTAKDKTKLTPHRPANNTITGAHITGERYFPQLEGWNFVECDIMRILIINCTTKGCTILNSQIVDSEIRENKIAGSLIMQSNLYRSTIRKSTVQDCITTKIGIQNKVEILIYETLSREYQISEFTQPKTLLKSEMEVPCSVKDEIIIDGIYNKIIINKCIKHIPNYKPKK